MSRGVEIGRCVKATGKVVTAGLPIIVDTETIIARPTLIREFWQLWGLDAHYFSVGGVNPRAHGEGVALGLHDLRKY
jgi:hypothetical protein